MADVVTKVSQIRQAVLGKDVRENIALGIEAINDQVEATTAAEAGRAQAENSRVAAEEGRASAENDRRNAFNTSESTRQTTFNASEASRKSTFDSNEATRQATFTTSEANRKSTFDTNEATRQTTFDTNEDARKTGETNRIASENSRVNAETGRVNAENTRVSEFNQIKSDYNTASKYNVVTYQDWSFSPTVDTTIFTIDMGIFNPVLDIAELSQNGSLLWENDNYTRNGAEITLSYTLKAGEKINVRVFKGVINDPPTADGSNMMDGSITKMKLSTDVVDKIDKVPGLETQLNDIVNNKIYVTTADELVNAITNAQNTQTIILANPNITLNTPLVLANVGDVKIKSDSKGKITFTGTGDIFTISNCSNIIIENINFIGNGANNGHGFVLSSSYRTRIINCLMYNVSKDCYNATNSWWSTTENCQFDKCGIGYSCINQGANSNNMLHLHDKLSPRGSIGILNTGGYQTLVSNCDISASEANSIGIVLQSGNGFSIEECYFEALATSIKVGDSTHFLVNVDISNNYISSANTGIVVENASNINIKNNNFQGGTVGIQIVSNSNNKRIKIDSTNYFISGIATKVIDDDGAASYENYTPSITQFKNAVFTTNNVTFDLKNNTNFLCVLPDNGYRYWNFTNVPNLTNTFITVNIVLDYKFACSMDTTILTWKGGTTPTFTAGKKYVITITMWYNSPYLAECREF